jgi:hypothetical protein
MTNNKTFLTNTQIKSKIFNICGIQVMIDRNLAELYGVETMVLNQDDTDIYKYHIGASLKDLGIKCFTFSKLDIKSVELINKLKL